MRLIDADATIKEIKARNPDDVSYEDAWAITCIEHAPTIEPERTGKWIRISPAKIYECSICGKNVMTADIDEYHFCHGCGARMES